jgi:hypothetical protein
MSAVVDVAGEAAIAASPPTRTPSQPAVAAPQAPISKTRESRERGNIADAIY